MHHCSTCPTREQGFFCALSDDHLARLSKDKVAHEYRSGQVIFYEGTPALAVFCVHAGLVRLYKSGLNDKETMIRLLRPGDIMGYRAVIADEVFAATAEAVENTTVCTVPRESFLQILREDHELSYQIMKHLARELRVSEDEMVYRLHLPVAERTARLLLMLADGAHLDGAGRPKKPATVIPVRREELARMIGTTPETLSRTLHGFARRGMLNLDRRRIVIRDAGALRRMAGVEPN
jgi:CRP/FNR family transcriptional regulator